jgi:NADH-quinone oxidoreductase subunit E
MVIVFKDAYEDLTPERLEQIIDAFEAGKGSEIKPGPQVDRAFSAPEGGPLTLLEDVKPVRTNLEPHREPEAPAAAMPPTDAGRAKNVAPEADASIKTPLTDKEGAKARVKAAQDMPLSATAKTDPDPKSAGSAVEGAPPEPGAVSGDLKPKRTRKKTGLTEGEDK